MRGDRKKSKTKFAKGNANWKRRVDHVKVEELPHTWKVLDEVQFKQCTHEDPNGLIVSTDADGNPAPSKFLRPRPRKTTQPDHLLGELKEIDINTDNRTVSQAKMVTMWNDIFKRHAAGTSCSNPNFKLHQEKKKGLGWEQKYVCSTCLFVSDFYKLYHEAVTPHKRGPKFATSNLGLATSLQDMPIGNKKARLMLTALGIPTPSRSSLQKISNHVGKKTEELVREDLKYEREKAHSVNALKGLPLKSPVNCSMDVRYNSQTIGSRKKFGQNASQAIGLVTENQTRDNEVVGFYMQNKLCWIGAHLRNSGFEVKCPGGHAGCTANTPKFDPLSEKEIGKALGAEFAGEDYLIKHLTTDGDSRSAEGMGQGYSSVMNTLWEVKRKADYVHLGGNQFRASKRASFSRQMFPATDSQSRELQQHVFCLDLKSRCHKIWYELHKVSGGNLNVIKAKLPSVFKSTIKCYAADHRTCRFSSLVCEGGVRNNWLKKSPIMNVSFAPPAISPTQEDLELLKNLLRIRLGAEAMSLTSHRTNTNKCEAMNRALSVSLPKNVNFSRNGPARGLSAVHRVKHGAGTSLTLKMTHLGAGSQLLAGGRVHRSLKQLDREDKYHRRYNRSTRVKLKILQSRYRSYRSHYHHKLGDYSRGQLDIHLGRKRRKRDVSNRDDHTYAALPDSDCE